MWKGTDMIEGSISVIEHLLANQKNVFFVTNNSTLSRASYAEKFVKKGFNGVKKENILCSAYAAARYLSMNNFEGKVYVIGETGIYEELAEHNIETIGDQFLHANMIETPAGSMTPDITLESNVCHVLFFLGD